MKFIYILRNPIDRIISHYLHNCFYFYSAKQVEFNQYLAVHGHNLLVTSLYFYQLSQFLKHFKLDSFLVITMEDLNLYPEQVMKHVFAFLNVDSQFQCKNLRVKHNTAESNTDMSKPKFNEHLYQQIRKIIEPDVQKLEFLLGRRLNWDLSASKYT